MATDRSAFIVVSFESSMTLMWRALHDVRESLSVARVYWNPDARFRDGRHFNFQIPLVGITDPLSAQDDVRSILLTHGASLT